MLISDLIQIVAVTAVDLGLILLAALANSATLTPLLLLGFAGAAVGLKYEIKNAKAEVVASATSSTAQNVAGPF